PSLAQVYPASIAIALLLVSTRRPPASTLFPSTTLFRSVLLSPDGDVANAVTRQIAMANARAAGKTQAEAEALLPPAPAESAAKGDRKSTRLNSSHVSISYAVFCLKKKKKNQ